MKSKTLMTCLMVFTLAGLGAFSTEAQLAAAMPQVGENVELRGVVQVIWGDPPPGSDQGAGHRYELVTDENEVWRLDLAPEAAEAAGGLLALSQSRVTVSGQVASAAVPKLVVDRIALDDSEAKQQRDVFGSQRYIWILLRFADNPSTPAPTSFFMDQALGGYPSLDHYYREVSYNNINLEGSIILGWYNLPHPRSHYVYDMDPEDPDEELDGDAALADAIAIVDPIVYFPDYQGIHLCFNDVLDCCSWGGVPTLTLDGVTRTWGVTWLADWGWQNQDVIAHETGHSIGWPHSSGHYGEIYDSRWDVMSLACGECNWVDPVYGNLAVNTISYNKNLAGWIHPLHKWDSPTYPVVQSLWLHQLAQVPPAGRLLQATVDWPTSFFTHYTFERRRLWGYDQNLPDSAVIIHSVNILRPEPAHVVDPDVNGDCNDEGARWDVGETFWDSTNEVVMTVEYADADASIITICNAPLLTVYVNENHVGSENGTPIMPWNTFHEGYGCAYPTGDVYILPGNYTAPYSLRKNASLRRWGGSGTVTIGH